MWDRALAWAARRPPGSPSDAGIGAGMSPGSNLCGKSPGRVIGVVRARKPDHQRERAVALVSLDEPPRLPPGEPVPRVLPRNVRVRRPSPLDVVAVLLPPQLPEAVRLQVVVVVVLDPCPELVLAGHPVPEPVPGVPGVEVHLPDGGREVPGLREYLRPGAYPGLVVVRPQRVQVVRHAVPQRAHARQQRRPGGHAQRRRRVGVVVPDALIGYPVDVGRPDEPRAVAAQEVPPQLVRKKKDDVGSVVHGLCSHPLRSGNAVSRSCSRALMHLERLGDAWAATSGRHRFRPSTLTNSIMRDVYAGPIDRPLPCLGAMSSRIALRREPLARSTRVSFGSSRSSTTLGTLPAGTPRNAAIPARSASSQLSISRTATRKHMPSAGVGSHSRQREGAHSSRSRSTRTIQGQNLAARLYPSILSRR